MPNDMDHERMRWRYMNTTEMERRLRKIRDRDKLRNFLLMCAQEWNNHRCNGQILNGMAGAHALSLGYQELADLSNSQRARREVTEDLTGYVSNSIGALSAELTCRRRATHAGTVVEVRCRHCSLLVTEVPIPGTREAANRVIERATYLIGDHLVSECAVLHPPPVLERPREAPAPKIRMIRMGKKGG